MFIECILCIQTVLTSNIKYGICNDCWEKIEEGDEQIQKKYFALDLTNFYYPKKITCGD
jgi:hypothetical protein